MRPALISLAVALAGALALAVGPAAADDDDLSEANRLLFMTPHLAGLPGPGVLHYRLEGSGEDGEPLADTIDLRVSSSAVADGWRVEVEYLSGPRRRYVPPVENARGNPLIKVFLQRQVVRLGEATGGHWRYFQKAVKTALAESARVETVRLEHGGDEVAATVITVAPYRDMEQSGRLAAYRSLRYRFVLSEEIPGQVLSLEAAADGGSAAQAVALAETVRFRSFDTPAR